MRHHPTERRGAMARRVLGRTSSRPRAGLAPWAWGRGWSSCPPPHRASGRTSALGTADATEFEVRARRAHLQRMLAGRADSKWIAGLVLDVVNPDELAAASWTWCVCIDHALALAVRALDMAVAVALAASVARSVVGLASREGTGVGVVGFVSHGRSPVVVSGQKARPL